MSVTIRSRARKGRATEVSVLHGGSVVHQGLRDTDEAPTKRVSASWLSTAWQSEEPQGFLALQWVCRTYGYGIGVHYDMGYTS